MTSGLPAFWHVAQWWNEPIVYQKVILWTVLLETIGVAGSWGPLAGKTKPMMGGILYWARPGTIRLRPWRRVPFTAGNRRTWFDVALYLALIVSVIVPLVLPGVPSDSLSAALPDNTSGLVNPALLIAPMVLLVLIGLRDKTIFLAARGEQYLPALFFFTVLPFVDMIIALKLLIVIVWVGAGVSKFGLHFTNVIPPMVSNSPTMPFKWLKRAHYRNYPERPASVASRHLHGARAGHRRGNRCPAYPVVLTLAVAHGDRGRRSWSRSICSSFRRSRWRCRWNGTCCSPTATIFLFLGFPNWDGYGIADMSSPWLTVAIVAGLLFFPVLGNLRPDLVSFLPAMRQYAGNWASAVWAFAPGAEEKLNRVTRSVAQPGRPAGRIRLRTAAGGDLHAANGRVAVDAQPGPRPVLGAGEEPPGYRHPDRP